MINHSFLAPPAGLPRGDGSASGNKVHHGGWFLSRLVLVIVPPRRGHWRKGVQIREPQQVTIHERLRIPRIVYYASCSGKKNAFRQSALRSGRGRIAGESPTARQFFTAISCTLGG